MKGVDDSQIRKGGMVRQECWRREVEMDGALSGTGHHIQNSVQTVLTVPQ